MATKALTKVAIAVPVRKHEVGRLTILRHQRATVLDMRISQIATDAQVVDDRQDSRQLLNLTGLLTSPLFEKYGVVVTELSRQGCRIHVGADLAVGTFVTLAMPGLGSVKGWIVWQKREEVGIAFTDEFSERVVDHTVGLG